MPPLYDPETPESSTSVQESSEEDNEQEARNFVNEVKAQFHADRDRYIAFLDALMDFKRGRIDTADLICLVRHLFHEHPNLFDWFSLFFHERYHTDSSEDSADDVIPSDYPIQETNESNSPIHKSPLEDRPIYLQDALNFLDEVKAQFYDDPDRYNAFIDVMKDFKTQVIDTPCVIRRTIDLFREYPSLLHGFNIFLPVGYSIGGSANPSDPDTITVMTPSDHSIHSNFMPTPPETQRDEEHTSTPTNRPEAVSTSVLAGAQGAVINGGTFIGTNSLHADSGGNILPYSLLAFQTALGAINTHSSCPSIERPPPFDLMVPYHMSLPIYYEDLPILFSPLVFMYLWKVIFGHRTLNAVF